MEIFTYITPFIYLLLVLIWAYILVFYFKKILKNNLNDNLLKTLLIVLGIDAFRTFFESTYFGFWYTSLAGIIPIGIYNFLAQPEIVFFPKTLNLFASFLILFILIRKWIPEETSRLENIKAIVKRQTKELQENINQLIHIGEKLKESEEKYKNAFEYFSFPVYMWQSVNSEFMLAFANRAALIKTTEKLETLLGTVSTQFWKKSPELNEYLKKCFDTKNTISIEHTFKNETAKKPKSYTITFSFVPPLNVQVIMVDITEQKIAENNLLEQKHLFETMFDTIQDGVIITNKEREILIANNGMKITFGYSPNDIIGKTTELLYENPENYKIAGEKVFNKNVKNPDGLYLTEYLKKDGTKFTGETFGNKLLDKEGNWIGNVGIIRDITERMKFIDEIKVAKEKAEESDRLKSAFLANMSHEIRTPLNSIIGFSKILSDRSEDNDENRKMKYFVEYNSNILIKIIDDIIDISKIEAGVINFSIEAVNINKLLNEILIWNKKILLDYQKQHIELLYNQNSENIILDTDKFRLNSIFTNLITNAIRYSESGSISFGFNILNDKIQFYVKDTGIGLSETDKVNIFSRFYKAANNENHRGIGLGLAITKQLIEKMGGEIWVESELGKGSEFYFSLPYQKAEEKSISEDLKSTPFEVKGKLALVAEDDDGNFYLTKLLLDEMGIEVLRAENGIEAVEICKTNDKISFVLMDIKMPKMDGFEATMKIREFNKELLIVALSAHVMEEAKDSAKKAGCDYFISKPLEENELIELIETLN